MCNLRQAKCCWNCHWINVKDQPEENFKCIKHGKYVLTTEVCDDYEEEKD